MSEFKFSCPHCDQHITIDEGWVGQAIACPGCQNQITVPAPPGPAEPVMAEAAEETAGVGGGVGGRQSGGGFPVVPVVVGVLVVAGLGVGGFFMFKGGAGDKAAPQTSDNAVTSEMPMDTGMNAGMDMNTGAEAPAQTASFAPAERRGTFPKENSWPQFRGPERDGVSREKGLAKQWPSGGPPLLWKATGCGGGYSSVAVAGGRVYTMGDAGAASALHCFDEATGAKVWSSRGLGATGGNYEGTKSTPTVDGGRVYALGQFGDLVCLDAASGSEVWRKNLTRDFSGKFSNWNYAESPLVDGDRLVVSPGGRAGLMLALNKADGRPIWRTREWADEAQYVSPVVAEMGGRRLYLQLTQRTLAGVDAETGRVAWRVAREGKTAIAPSPVVHNDIVFVTSGYGVGCNAFKVESSGSRMAARQIYANREMINHHGGVVLVDGHVYGSSDPGDWKCIDVTTGRRLWSERGVRKGAVVYADGHLYCRGENDGAVALVEATPEGYREKGRLQQPDRSRQKAWAHPVVVNGRLYLRDQDLLLCYDVRE